MLISKRLLPILIVCIWIVALCLIVRMEYEKKRRLEPSATKLIDDFNDGTDPNLIGGNQFINISDKAFCRTAYDKTETHGRGGFSCGISYYAPKDGWSIWGTDLNELDISAAENLSLWVKGFKGGEEFEIRISDADGSVAGVDINRYIKVGKDWQRTAIPVRDFPRVNFNHLKSISLIFRGKPDQVSGMIYIDDISFTGRPELLFHSLKDNLKGFPIQVALEWRKRNILNKRDKDFLRIIAKDTWNYFENTIDTRHNLPLDSIDLLPEKRIGDYTSLTNIGLYLMCVISAYDLGFIDQSKAINRLRGCLDTLEKLPTWNRHLYNFYSTTNLQIGREYISSVDEGWLAVGLIIVRQAFPDSVGKQCSKLLEQMDFSLFYNKDIGQLSVGYDTKEKSLSPYHYGLLATEPRIASFVAIGKGDIPPEHWFKIFRALPKEWDWQSQVPQGEWRKYLDIDVFEGYYTYGDGVNIVPSWGGSLFEFLMPTLVLKERELAPKGLGLNDFRAIGAHIQFAKDKGYPVWGISPSSTPDGNYGGYSEFGIASLGAKGYKDEGIITPYTTFLALEFLPKETVKNIRKLLDLYPIYGVYGLFDSVNVKTKRISYRYLALDQGMILVALNNYLNNGIIRERFHRDEIGKRAEFLLGLESFF